MLQERLYQFDPPLIVYTPVNTALSVIPALYAMAFSVSVLFTATGELYTFPTLDVGVLPSVVYRIEAPAVVVLIVTDCPVPYGPAGGLNVGVATCAAMTVKFCALLVPPAVVTVTLRTPGAALREIANVAVI